MTIQYVEVKRPNGVKAALKEVLKLYTSSRRWTQGYYARTKKRSGQEVTECDVRAHCWCLSGAVTRVCGHEDNALLLRHKVMDVLDKAVSASEFRDKHGEPFAHIVPFNDAKDRKFADVVKIVKSAIKLAA